MLYKGAESPAILLNPLNGGNADFNTGAEFNFANEYNSR